MISFLKTNKRVIMLVSIILGYVLGWCIIFFILSSSGSGLLADKDPKMASLYGFIILVCSILYFFINRSLIKIKKSLLILSIIISFSLMWFTPVFILIIDSVHENIEQYQAGKVENKKLRILADMIKQNQLPYDLNFEQSNLDSNLSPSKTTYVRLTKRTTEKITRSEVFDLINLLPLNNTVIVIKDRSSDEFINFYIDSHDKLTRCDPYDKCHQLDINTRRN